MLHSESAAAMFRGGKGVLYREILKDVCDEIKAKYNKDDETIVIEEKLFSKLLEDALDRMTDDEKIELAKDAGIPLGSLTAHAVNVAGGLISYKLAVIIANGIVRQLMGHGLKLAASIGIVRGGAIFTGPIGWAITGLWAANDIAGAAYRVTLPAVMQVALLRRSIEVNR